MNISEEKRKQKMRKTNLEVRKVGTALVVQWLRICLPVEHGLDPWSGKIPHSVEELNLCTQLLSTTEAHVPRARAPQEKPLQ